MSRVYVAGKWEDKRRVKEVQNILIEAGHAITFDWTRQLDVPPSEAALNRPTGRGRR